MFIDNYGICVIATADYLKVNYHIVGTSNTEEAPVSKFGRFDEERPVFHIGYYQDTTDDIKSVSRRAGHYQSLDIVPNKALSCCGVSSPITISHVVESESIARKIHSEELILKALATNNVVVNQSLQRLIEIKSDITVDVLFETRVCSILMEDIRPLYNSKTDEGKKCRKLLK